jgi:hypothetical protein
MGCYFDVGTCYVLIANDESDVMVEITLGELVMLSVTTNAR